jgi:phosphoserine phosphatase SerB
VLTLLAKAWNQERAQAFLTNAESQGLSLQADTARPLESTDLWMQRVWARSQTELSTESLEHLRKAAETAGLDVFAESEALYHTPRRLFVFDMDSTLIQAEIIDELAGLAGVKDEVSSITAAAMRGDIDFPTSLTRRVSLLKGVRENRIGELKAQIALGEGLENLMLGLKAAGCKTAILSGGFGFFGRYLQQRLGFDYLYSNELEIVDGTLTGRLATAIGWKAQSQRIARNRRTRRHSAAAGSSRRRWSQRSADAGAGRHRCSLLRQANRAGGGGFPAELLWTGCAIAPFGQKLIRGPDAF